MAEGSPSAPQSVSDVLEAQALEVVFQPIVSLPRAETVAFQALARGPKGSRLELPGAMFTAARAEGLLTELDFACQEAALRAAMASGLTRPFGLFVKVEADLVGEMPQPLRSLYAEVSSRLKTVVEVTEEALADEPARVLARARELRRLGCMVALGHVGAGGRPSGTLPLLEPDVIKLDMSLIRRETEEPTGDVVHAVGIEAWRRGLSIVAEGLEDPRHVDVARSMGATFGQGWHFAGSRGFNVIEADALLAPDEPGSAGPDAISPARIVSDAPAARTAARPVIEGITRRLEAEAQRIGPGALLEQYDGPDGEWVVALVSAHLAAVLVALSVGEDATGPERRYRYVLSYDRATAIAAARTLLARSLA